jgi:glycosyltransferase involved in cell wall biosynthesis
MRSNHNLQFFSIIVPAHNEENYIVTLLSDLYNQTLPKEFYEVLIVDNASSDDTVENIWKFSIKHTNLNLRLIHENQLGVSRARNKGALCANNPNLIFLDADNTVKEDFLTTIRDRVEDPKILAATFRTLPDQFDIRALIFFWSIEILKMLRLKPFGKSFVRRSALNEIDGFNENIHLGENVDMLFRIKQYARIHSKKFIHISKPEIKCSLRRFEKLGYLKIIIPWFIAYLGVKHLDYKTMHSISGDKS